MKRQDIYVTTMTIMTAMTIMTTMTIAIMMIFATMMIMATMRKVEVLLKQFGGYVRKLEIVHKEFEGYLTMCARITASIALNDESPVTQSVSNLPRYRAARVAKKG